MTATLLDEPLAPGSEAWLQTISASQVGAILGLDPWTTAHQLWHSKAGTVPRNDKPATDAQKRGHELEPLILAHLAEQHPDWAITAQPGTYRHACGWATANPDGIADLGDEQVIVEIKSVHPDSVKHWRDGPPHHYLAQVQWMFHVLGLDRAVIAMASGYELFGRRPREYQVDRDQQFIDDAVAACNAFRMSVAMGVEPPADYSVAGDREVLRWKNPRIEPNPGIELPDELAQAWLAALAATTGAEDAEAVARAQMLAFLGEGRTATWRGQILGTRRSGREGKPPTFARTRGLNPTALLAPDTDDLQENAA